LAFWLLVSVLVFGFSSHSPLFSEIDFQLLVIDEKPPLQELSDEEIGKLSQEAAVAYIMGMRQQWAEKDAEMDRQHAETALRTRSHFLQGVMNQLSSPSTSSS